MVRAAPVCQDATVPIYFDVNGASLTRESPEARPVHPRVGLDEHRPLGRREVVEQGAHALESAIVKRRVQRQVRHGLVVRRHLSEDRVVERMQ